MRPNLRDNGKMLGIVAYGVWSAAAFLGICVLKLWEAALPRLWMRTHHRCVFIYPPPAADHMSFLSSWNENRVLSKLLKTIQFR